MNIAAIRQFDLVEIAAALALLLGKRSEALGHFAVLWVIGDRPLPPTRAIVDQHTLCWPYVPVGPFLLLAASEDQLF